MNTLYSDKRPVSLTSAALHVMNALIFLLAGLSPATIYANQSIALTSAASTATTTAIAAEGYIYGFPIVLMDETRKGMTGPLRSCTFGTDINTFKHVLDLPDPEFKAVVRPNVDTLYSSAMLDLSEGPLVMTLPDVPDHYVLMAFMDAWSNNFAGIDTTGENTLAGEYLITGPDWRGRIPRGMTQIAAPTNLVWIIGRTELLSPDDIYTVNQIQTSYELKPYDPRVRASHGNQADCLEDSEKQPPIDIVLSMSGETFFSRLSELMIENPPPRDQRTMEVLLASINTGRFADGDVEDLSRIQKRQLDAGIRLAQGSLDTAKQFLGLSGWGPNPRLVPLGEYGKRYFIRAMVAQIGFGANKNEYAVYQNAERDSLRRNMNGQYDYTLTFKADDMPDVGAFWSITAYGDDGFLKYNEHAATLGIERYALSTNTPLERDENGDITLYISSQPPQGVPLSNWLPVPNEDFQLTLRFYDPGEEILSGTWKVPDVVRAN
jgi:DNA sulfur modification protein DndE